MKQYINLLILVVVGVVAFTIYGLITFQPDEAKPFVFSEPKLPPEIQKEYDALNSAEGKQQQQAVKEVQAAISKYKAMEDALPEQARDTVAVLVDRVANSDLPPYFLTVVNPQTGARVFEALNIDTKNVSIFTPGQRALGCSNKGALSKVLIGSSEKDTLSCDQSRDITGQAADGDLVFIGGPENDTITDTSGNRIVNGGTGDDNITLGSGRSILVLEASWGHDKVTVDCTGAHVTPADIPKGFPIPWVGKTTNFIVLGNNIDPQDIVWNGNVLSNVKTNDSLTVNENCFTVVPSAQ